MPPVRASLVAVRLAGGLVMLAAALGTLLVGLTGVAAPAGAQGEPTTTTAPSQTTTTEGPSESIGGRIRDPDGEPVEGVRLTVSQDGEEIDEDETDDEGEWRVAVPGAGLYDVELDAETLPEDIGLRNPDRPTLEDVEVRAGQAKTVLFPLGDPVSGGSARLDRLATLTAQGVKFGAIIALTAVGLSLIFGITGLVNFAHGELVAFGAIVAWYLNADRDGPGVTLVAAAVVATVAGGGLGWGLERGLWRPLRRRGTGLIALLVVSIGLALVLRHIFLVVYGGASRPYADYTRQRARDIGPFTMTPKDIVIIVLSLAVLALVGLLLERTRLGTAMRAVADNRELAESSGIDVNRIVLVTWVLGGALAALGGVLQGVSESVTWDMGLRLLLLMFAAVVVGGLGTAYGAMLGGLLIGVVAQVSTYWVSTEFKFVFALGTLIAVLLVRPQGILGRAQRVG